MKTLFRCTQRTGPVRACKLPSFVQHRIRLYKAENGHIHKFGATYHHDTVFAPKHCSCQKEAMGKESLECNPCFGAKSAQTCTCL